MTDRLWSVPDSWTWTEMSVVAQVVGGGTPSTTDKQNFCEPGKGIAWVTPADLSGYNKKTISRGARDITAKGLSASGATLMPSGTVLFSSRAPIGYVAIARGSVCTNQGFKSFVPGPGLDPEFLYYYLHRARQLAVDLASGTTFKEISGAKARTIPLPMAPLAEQRRIAECLDDVLSRIDAAVASLERAQVRLKAYRASVLKAAVEGRLVPIEAELARKDGRSYEPADALLARMLKERRHRWEKAELAKMTAAGKAPKDDRWKAKYPHASAPNRTNRPALPEGWCWTSVGEVAPLQPGYAFASSGFRPVGVRLLKGSNVRDGWIASDEVDHWPEANAERFESYRLSEGDVVLAMDRPVYSSGSRATKVALLDAGWNGCFLLQRVGCFRRCQPLDSHYLYLFVSGAAFRDHIILEQKGSQDGKDLPHVSSRTVDQCPFPLPPAAEQARIAEEAERLLSVATQASQAVDIDLRRCRRLRQSVLKWAFEGKLADQDASDEPARQLLSRIRNEQAVAVSTRKTRKLRTAS